MANQKSTIHDIPLKTQDLCLNVFDGDIKPYEGFRKNNSPFYGSTLSPFYYKKSVAVGDKTYVHTDGVIYTIKDDGNLYSIADNEIKLLDLSDGYFLEKKTIYSSGNESYPTILGFFDEGANESTMLCSSNEGDLAIINSDGTVKVTITVNGGYKYSGNETVGFMERSSAGAYCFVLGNSIFCTNVAGTTAYRYTVGSETTRTNSYAFSCVTSEETSTFTVCAKSVTSINALVLNIVYGDTVTFNRVTRVIGKLSASTIDYVNPSGTHALFFTKGGYTIFASNAYRVQEGSQYKVFNFATGMKRASGDGANEASCQIVESKYLTIENLAEDKYEQLYSVCDNYSATEILGYSNGGYTKVIPGKEHYGVEPITATHMQTMSYPNGFGGYTTITYPITTVVGERVTYYRDPDTYVHIPGGYRSMILNGVTGQSYQGVPIWEDGTYTGGFMTSFGDNFRLLYQSGHLQAISVCPDERTVGTLVCGMGEIDTTFPVCFAIARKTVYYKNDSGTWESVTLTKDVSKASLSLANDRYLIINTDRYYNCFDIVDHTLHHFASDWNDRVILETEATFEDIPNTLDGYIKNCEQYSYTSAQGSNYVLMNTPFISSLFAPNVGIIPKNLKAIKPKAIAGYTPNNQDIDIYYDKVSTDSNGPKYKYSMDMENDKYITYINAVLTGQRYAYKSAVLIPSIFAKFINGFINQGIIVDNGHSYVQLFANTSKPIFAINLASQLEGVTSAFIIQGQYYVIINNSIYRYDPDSGAIAAVVNIASMQLIGYTPYMAIFWSGTNKTFYTFQGDNTLNLLVQADEIASIKYSAYNPNTMSIYVITDDSIYIFGNGQLLRLELQGYTKCYPLYSGAAFTGSADTLYLSYNELEGYEPAPIEIETEFYGHGNGIKAVNDCVYIRLFSQKMKMGVVKLSCQTLNETGKQSEVKQFNITPDMWDKQTRTLFLRYQPKFQAATGFSVHISSPFSIASLQIGETQETVQNSKYNM